MMMATARRRDALDTAAESLANSIPGVLVYANFDDKRIEVAFIGEEHPEEKAKLRRLIKDGWNGWPVKIKGAK